MPQDRTDTVCGRGDAHRVCTHVVGLPRHAEAIQIITLAPHMMLLARAMSQPNHVEPLADTSNQEIPKNSPTTWNISSARMESLASHLPIHEFIVATSQGPKARQAELQMPVRSNTQWDAAWATVKIDAL